MGSTKPLAVDGPLLLLEREVYAEIGINWFLDQEILKGGYVRILAESWEERLGKIRIRTTEGLTTSKEPHRGWTIASSSWDFFTKAKVRPRTRADHSHPRGNQAHGGK